jgi:hypothetical protein
MAIVESTGDTADSSLGNPSVPAAQYADVSYFAARTRAPVSDELLLSLLAEMRITNLLLAQSAGLTDDLDRLRSDVLNDWRVN